MGFLRTALNVLRLTGPLLTMIPPQTGAAEQTLDLGGGVQAYMKGTVPQIANTNSPKDGKRVCLNFTTFLNGEGSSDSTSVQVQLSPGQAYPAASTLRTFENGNLAVFDPEVSASSGLLEIVRYFVTLLPGLPPTNVAGDVNIGLQRLHHGGYELYIRLGASVNVKSAELNSSASGITWQQESEPNESFYAHGEELKFPVPDAVDASCGIKVDGKLVIDRKSYDALVALSAAEVYQIG